MKAPPPPRGGGGWKKWPMLLLKVPGHDQSTVYPETPLLSKRLYSGAGFKFRIPCPTITGGCGFAKALTRQAEAKNADLRSVWGQAVDPSSSLNPKPETLNPKFKSMGYKVSASRVLGVAFCAPVKRVMPGARGGVSQ